jgi:hypothetical protein
VKALTVQQPWAWAVLSGKIDYFIEPFPPQLRGYFLIHAGIGWDFNLERWFRGRGTVVPTGLIKSMLLGYTRLTTVSLRRPGAPEAHGRFVFTVTDTHEIDPYVAAGRRGFWPVPKRMLEEIDLPDHVLDYAL